MKLCECGCGNPAPISKTNRSERNQRKGEPVRFILGHSQRGRNHTREAKAKIAAAGRGRTPSVETRQKIAASKVGLKHTAEAKAQMSRSQKLRAKADPRYGERAPGWKRGRTVVRGRALVFVGRDHPMADSRGYVYEHRLVLAGVLGRFLSVDEHVHHIDNDPLNNAPENLVVVSASQHMRIHRFIQYGRADEHEAVRMVLAAPVGVTA